MKIKAYLPFLLTALFLALYVFCAYIFDIPCPIKYLTGLSCLGCGMTRACASALSLNFTEAFYYHPLWCAVPILVALLLTFHLRKNKKAFYATLFVCVALFAFIYVYRIVTHSPVLSFNLQNGAIYKSLARLIGFFK